MKLSDYIFETVSQRGARHVFMLPGGGCMHLVDSLGRHPKLEFVTVLHEQAAAIAADAYAQYTNNLGVCLVTTGPGGTNAITGVLGSWNDSTPVLVLSGQVKRSDLMDGYGVRQMGPQEADIISIVRPITKYAVSVRDPSEVRFHLEKALYLATHGRPGPVWLDVPLDVQAADLDPASLRGYEPEPAPAGTSGVELRGRAGAALDRLARATRPVVFAGNGVRLAKAQPAFEALIERLQVPVLLTWKALDFLPEDHPLLVGRPGIVAQRAANLAQQNADWMLVLGNRLDRLQTAFNPQWFARAAHKIVVDIDGAEIAKQGFADVDPVIADVSAYLDAMHAELDARGGVPFRDDAGWRERTQDWKRRYPVMRPEYRMETGGVNLYVLMDALSSALAPGDLFVPGSSGACSEVAMQAFPSRRGIRVFNTEGLGPMGFGPPAALGACVASGRKRTVCVDGDGGFAMNFQELETIRRLALPVKIFVLDNGGYGSIVATQSRYFDGRLYGSVPEFGLTLPDPCRVAEAMDIATAHVESHEALPQVLRSVLDAPGPVVCKVKVSPHQATQPRVASKQLPDGRMVSAPMEDLFPFLDPEEQRANMFVPPPEEVV